MSDLAPDKFQYLTELYAAEGKKVVGYRMTQPGVQGSEDQNYPRLEIDWVYNVLTNGSSHA